VSKIWEFPHALCQFDQCRLHLRNINGPIEFFLAQAAMQNRSGQTRPHTPPRGFACMISPAERRISDGFPTRPAMMKSNGEQFTGHASLHGFSSQYSHLLSSVWSWAFVRMRESILPFFSMDHLESENCLELSCMETHKYIIAFADETPSEIVRIWGVFCHVCLPV